MLQRQSLDATQLKSQSATNLIGFSTHPEASFGLYHQHDSTGWESELKQVLSTLDVCA